MIEDLKKSVCEIETLEEAKLWDGSLRKGRTYLAGPMTGVDNYNYPKFHELARLGASRYWNIQNPGVLGTKEGSLDPQFEDASKHPQILGLVLISGLNMLATCNSIVMLDGWEASSGATMELLFSRRLRIPALSETGYRRCLEFSRYEELAQLPSTETTSISSAPSSHSESMFSHG